MNSLTVIPAYGRDYKSKEEVKEAWESNKDFQIANPGVSGRYINLDDAKRYGVTQINVRYSNKTKKMIITVGE